MDAALALLDGYEEEDDAVATMRGLTAVDVDDLALVRLPHTTKASSDRFKRARERKKSELSLLRSQSRGLEETLRRLKQQRLTATNNDQLVWHLAAMRQQHERDEAEQLNAQLRKMVDATLKQTRRLRAMMAYPEGLDTLVHHKRLRPHPEHIVVASLVEFHGLLITLDLLELEVDELIAPSQNKPNTPTRDVERSKEGCRLLVEVVDTSVVPYNVAVTSETAWRSLVNEKFPGASQNDAQSTVSRTFGMDVVNGSFQLSYTGSIVYRRRILHDRRVVILWASEWEPVGLRDWSDIAHESVRRQGFVCVSPCHTDPTRFSRVQTFHRIERDACGDPTCDRGALGDETVAKAERAVAACVADEIQRTIQSMENDLMTQSKWGAAPATKVERALSGCSVKHTIPSPEADQMCDVSGFSEEQGLFGLTA